RALPRGARRPAARLGPPPDLPGRSRRRREAAPLYRSRGLPGPTAGRSRRGARPDLLLLRQRPLRQRTAGALSRPDGRHLAPGPRRRLLLPPADRRGAGDERPAHLRPPAQGGPARRRRRPPPTVHVEEVNWSIRQLVN